MLTLFVVGGDRDMVLRVAVQNSDGLHSFLVDRLAMRPEVGRFRRSMMFQRVHSGVVTALDVPV